MTLEYIHRDNSRELIKFEHKIKTTSKFEYLSSSNKLEYVKKFVPAFHNHQKMVLFDSNHKQLLEFHQSNDINKFDGIEKVHSELIFFTSGSSGFPVGAFKTRQNLLKEVAVLKELLSKYDIKRVVTTVPFVHIYGVLAGLLLPLSFGDAKLILKEDFYLMSF